MVVLSAPLAGGRLIQAAARAQVPSMVLAIPPMPTATADSVIAVAGVSGGLAVAAQLGLVALFKKAKNKPWLSESPGYVAHQLIALVFMTIATVVGAAAWFAPAPWMGSGASRFLLDNGTTRFLAAMLFGELVLWDLPCAIWIKELRRPDSLIHHVAMAAVAFNAAWLAPIFYGASQSTSCAPQVEACTLGIRALIWSLLTPQEHFIWE